MTVHNSGDALAAEMMAIGAAARTAARAMREAPAEAKTKALMIGAAAIRRRADEIFAANKGDLDQKLFRMNRPTLSLFWRIKRASCSCKASWVVSM